MILLMGRRNHAGNLVIESSEQFPDDTPGSVIDALVGKQDNDDNMAWAASFPVDTHARAIQEAAATYLDDDEEIIDNVHGILINR